MWNVDGVDLFFRIGRFLSPARPSKILDDAQLVMHGQDGEVTLFHGLQEKDWLRL